MQKKIYKYLEHKFTEDEKKGHAETLAILILKNGNLERKKKEINAQIKAEQEALEAQIKKISTEYNQGYFYENVRCIVDYDYDLGLVTIKREDNDLIIEKRNMRDDELNHQPDLPEYEEN